MLNGQYIIHDYTLSGPILKIKLLFCGFPKDNTVSGNGGPSQLVPDQGMPIGTVDAPHPPLVRLIYPGILNIMRLLHFTTE